MALKHIEKLLELLREKDRYLITTHERPDADGLGAQIGLDFLLRSWNKDTIIFNQDPNPRLYNSHGVSMLNVRENTPIVDLKGRTVIIVDANTKDRIGSIAKYIADDESNLIIIDHHEGTSADYKNSFIYPETSACCEIIYQLIEMAKVKIPKKTAEAIYRGIILDTGHFKYGKTTGTTHRIVANLLEAGISPAKVSEDILGRWTYKRLEARKILYQNLAYTPCKRIGWFSINHSEITRLQNSDPNIFEDIALDIFEAKEFYITVLFAEREKNSVRASLRSRNGINLLPVISQFGGGGHASACGIKVAKPLETVISEIISALLDDPNLFENSTGNK